jgi:urease accessory protein
VVLAGPDLPAPALLGVDAAVMPLAGPGLLATAVGPDIRPVRAALDPICAGYPAGVRPEPQPDLQPAAPRP